jgi:hypothetical protein
MALASSSRLGAKRLGKRHTEGPRKKLTAIRFIPPIMTNASLILLWCLFGILFYFYGKMFRRWSKNSSVHQM